MAYGGMHPWPRRFGGNRYSGKPLLEVVQDSLAAARGAAFRSDDPTTVVWLENHAYARAITFDGWGCNDRLSMQWDPVRATDMLSRWEAVFNIRPPSWVTDRSRRLDLEARWQRFGGPANHSRLTTSLESALGDYFVAVEYIDPSIAVVCVPDGTYPWGTYVSGTNWTSTVAHLLVRLQKPSGATESQFYDAAAKVPLVLDPILSSFYTFNWYRGGASSYSVSGGPSAGGFFLDETNLDNEVFGA